jgi:hypothetical protein
VTYQAGKDVVADYFDFDLNKIEAHGIHYFKSLLAAFMYMSYSRFHAPDYICGSALSFSDSGRLTHAGSKEALTMIEVGKKQEDIDNVLNRYLHE